MKKIILPLLLLGVTSVAYAQVEADLADMYFSGESPKLTKQEQAAIAIAEKWSAGSDITKPVTGPDGAIKFLFGATRASIVCAVLQVCDIELEPGEQVNNINIGDPARWTIDPAITGNGSNEIQHIIVKPMDVGLDTTLIITTDRRAYHLRLRSHRTQYMPRVSFTYPENALAKWQTIKKQSTQERQNNTLPVTGEYLGNLDFAYTISGNTRWTPVRVYNDGKKTIIQMPSEMQQTEAPTLLVVRKDGGLFSDDETVLVNYRVHGDRYIVDTLFDKAILIAGVGGSQDKVTITKGK